MIHNVSRVSTDCMTFPSFSWFRTTVGLASARAVQGRNACACTVRQKQQFDWSIWYKATFGTTLPGVGNTNQLETLTAIFLTLRSFSRGCEWPLVLAGNP